MPSGIFIRTKEHNDKISESLRKNPPNKGRKFSEEWKKRLSESHKGYTPSEETRKKISLANKGENNPFFGRHWSQEDKDRLRRLKLKTGIWSYFRFKKGQCERCPSKDSLLVHHKDYDRYNNDLENLETLCKGCHTREHNLIKNLGMFVH